MEEAAREARYAFLFAAAEAQGAEIVLVAHTADDQAETVLMHLLRGAGLDGLRGMAAYASTHPWHQSIPLVRPMLKVWREEVESYCQANGLTPRDDSSNQDITFYRNRLRHELLPSLQSYNPEIKDALLRLSKTG